MRMQIRPDEMACDRRVNMKMREVVLRAIAKKITWDQAADILGMSHSAMWRLRGLYQRRGYDGFWVRATRKPGGLPVPLSDLEKVLLLYQQRYSHLDPRSFQKILSKKHSIHLDCDWLSQALREAGLTSQTQDHPEHN
jgi:hypothetical protein